MVQSNTESGVMGMDYETVSNDLQWRQAEIEKIDRKMKQLRWIIILLASLLLVIVLAGVSTVYHSPHVPTPVYTIKPTPEIVWLPSPTYRATPTLIAASTSTVPYAGMAVPYVPSQQTW